MKTSYHSPPPPARLRNRLSARRRYIRNKSYTAPVQRSSSSGIGKVRQQTKTPQRNHIQKRPVRSQIASAADLSALDKGSLFALCSILERQDVKPLQFFRALDINNSDSVREADLRRVLRVFEIFTSNVGAARLFNEMDHDHDGIVSKHDWMRHVKLVGEEAMRRSRVWESAACAKQFGGTSVSCSSIVSAAHRSLSHWAEEQTDEWSNFPTKSDEHSRDSWSSKKDAESQIQQNEESALSYHKAEENDIFSPDGEIVQAFMDSSPPRRGERREMAWQIALKREREASKEARIEGALRRGIWHFGTSQRVSSNTSNVKKQIQSKSKSPSKRKVVIETEESVQIKKKSSPKPNEEKKKKKVSDSLQTDSFFNDENVQNKGKELNVNLDDVDKVVSRLHKLRITPGHLFSASGGNRLISPRQFSRGLALVGLRPLPEKEKINAIFNVLDQRKEGYLTIYELREALDREKWRSFVKMNAPPNTHQTQNAIKAATTRRRSTRRATRTVDEFTKEKRKSTLSKEKNIEQSSHPTQMKDVAQIADVKVLERLSREKATEALRARIVADKAKLALLQVQDARKLILNASAQRNVSSPEKIPISEECLSDLKQDAEELERIARKRSLELKNIELHYTNRKKMLNEVESDGNFTNLTFDDVEEKEREAKEALQACMKAQGLVSDNRLRQLKEDYEIIQQKATELRKQLPSVKETTEVPIIPLPSVKGTTIDENLHVKDEMINDIDINEKEQINLDGQKSELEKEAMEQIIVDEETPMNCVNRLLHIAKGEFHRLDRNMNGTLGVDGLLGLADHLYLSLLPHKSLATNEERTFVGHLLLSKLDRSHNDFLQFDDFFEWFTSDVFDLKRFREKMFHWQEKEMEDLKNVQNWRKARIKKDENSHNIAKDGRSTAMNDFKDKWHLITSSTKIEKKIFSDGEENEKVKEENVLHEEKNILPEMELPKHENENFIGSPDIATSKTSIKNNSPWNEKEEAALVHGIDKYCSFSGWQSNRDFIYSQILRDREYADVLKERSVPDLEEKWNFFSSLNRHKVLLNEEDENSKDA